MSMRALSLVFGLVSIPFTFTNPQIAIYGVLAAIYCLLVDNAVNS